MQFQTPLALKPRTTFYVARADELHDLPHLLPIPGLFPAHRLSLVVGTSGAGLTQLACHLGGPASPRNVYRPIDQAKPVYGQSTITNQQVALYAHPLGTALLSFSLLPFPRLFRISIFGFRASASWGETCAPDPLTSAQVLTPQAPATPPTPSDENLSTCPTSTPPATPEDTQPQTSEPWSPVRTSASITVRLREANPLPAS